MSFELAPLFVGGMPGTPEMLVILLIAVLLFGANKIPKLARSTGEAMGEFKKGRKEVENELQEMKEPFEEAEEEIQGELEDANEEMNEALDPEADLADAEGGGADADAGGSE